VSINYRDITSKNFGGKNLLGVTMDLLHRYVAQIPCG